MHYYFYTLKDFITFLILMSSNPKCRDKDKCICFKSFSILGVFKLLIIIIICIIITILFVIICYIFLPEPTIDKIKNKTEGWDGFFLI